MLPRAVNQGEFGGRETTGSGTPIRWTV